MKCPHCSTEPLKVIGSSLKNFSGEIRTACLLETTQLSEYVVELVCQSCLSDVPVSLLQDAQQIRERRHS